MRTDGAGRDVDKLSARSGAWPAVVPGRQVTGISAVLLPFGPDGEIDWAAFAALLSRTIDAGLTPAVNMDTGYVHLLNAATRARVLDVTRSALGPDVAFVAGAFVGDEPADPFDAGAYERELSSVQTIGAIPVIFPSFGLTALDPATLLAAYRTLAANADRFIAFELGTMFAPFGRIFDLSTFEGIMSIDNCVGLKHSSLSRAAEWDRLALRDAHRPDFSIYTGNDLAIDMVMYGSDYLLGLSAFAPDHFARRDRYWEAGDPRFYELNDVLQYLGSFAFRQPVPAYKHTAAQFLHLRGWIPTPEPHPDAPRRPDSDRPILAALLERLESLGDGDDGRDNEPVAVDRAWSTGATERRGRG